jgi:hypothetical protein
MASRVLHYERRIGQPTKVIHLTLRPPVPSNIVSAAAPLPPAAPTSPNFWTAASTTEKALIVAGGLGAVILLYFTMKPGRRR